MSTLGDPFRNGYLGRPSVPRSFLQAAQRSDLVMLTSMGVLADYVARYTRAPILLSPNGACQVRFAEISATAPPAAPEFDVVFIGSRNASRNPLRPYHAFARRRERLVDALSRRFGSRFAVFGHGWEGRPSAQGPVPFDQQAEAARRGRVVVGGVPYSTARYYTSNRPFIQMTSGVPLVDSFVPGVETLFRPEEHWILADEHHLVSAVERVLEMGDERRSAIGQAAAAYVLSRHTQAHRVASLVENARRLADARRSGGRPAPYLPYFLSDVDTAPREPFRELGTGREPAREGPQDGCTSASPDLLRRACSPTIWVSLSISFRRASAVHPSTTWYGRGWTRVTG